MNGSSHVHREILWRYFGFKADRVIPQLFCSVHMREVCNGKTYDITILRCVTIASFRLILICIPRSYMAFAKRRVFLRCRSPSLCQPRPDRTQRTIDTFSPKVAGNANVKAHLFPQIPTSSLNDICQTENRTSHIPSSIPTFLHQGLPSSPLALSANISAASPTCLLSLISLLT